ncbi:MAG: extracellular solute-binding protein [Proteobacteria bacterium]|nr:extracellular solute-binding protein [Pseudomonadota bacterium]MBI3496204.1 extracellular solute-binding protein [Pseudomonadota bacterium]
MTGITRRGLIATAASAALLGSSFRQAKAQAAGAAATRSLPRTYAGTTLKITWSTTPSFTQITNFCEEFTNASGIRLEFLPLLQADRYQKLILDLTSGTNAFDVYLAAYQWKDQFAPYVADLMGIDKEIKGVPPLEWADYPQRALDAYARYENRMVAIPLIGDASLLVWNKAALSAAGLDPDKPPATWDAVYQAGRKLTRDKQYGFNMPAGKSIQTACIWITLFHAFGGQYFDAKGQPAFASEPSIRAIRFMAEQLGKVSPPGNLTWDFPEMLNSLSTGQSAQGFMWTGGFSTLFDPAKSAIAGSIGHSATPEAVLLGGWGIAVNGKTRNLDAAKLFVGWLTSQEISAQTALVTGTPCRTSAFKDPAVLKKFPILADVLTGMEGRVAIYPPIKESEQINIMIYDETNAACSGTKTPELAAADLQEKVTTFMKRRGYLKT